MRVLKFIRHKNCRWGLLGLCLFSASLWAQIFPKKIEVFFNDKIPVIQYTQEPAATAPIEINYYNLDVQEALTTELEQHLIKDNKVLEDKVDEFERNGGKIDGFDFMGGVKAAYDAKQKLSNLELTKLPAMVFDEGAAVVYGVSDVKAAIKKYQEWKEGRLHPVQQR